MVQPFELIMQKQATYKALYGKLLWSFRRELVICSVDSLLRWIKINLLAQTPLFSSPPVSIFKSAPSVTTNHNSFLFCFHEWLTSFIHVELNYALTPVFLCSSKELLSSRNFEGIIWQEAMQKSILFYLCAIQPTWSNKNFQLTLI